MAKSRILIVSEDASLRAMLARWLLAAGYAVELAESPRHAQEVVAKESLNLALVDQHLADADFAGELVRQIKRVIMIAQPAPAGGARSDPSVRSDACLAWPCSELDLLKKVRSELESGPTVAVEDGPQRLRFEGYTLDAEARSCLDAAGREVTLTRAEFSLLLAFARQPGRVLSRDELTHVVAGRGATPDDRSVDVLISRLRRKIEPDPKMPRLVVTMPGEGYKFTAMPQEAAPDSAIAAPSAAVATIAVTKGVSGDVSPVRAAETPDTMRLLRVLVPAAAMVLVAVVGWKAWSNHPVLREPASASVQTAAPAAQPGPSAERRAAAFKRMVEAMQDDRFSWRTLERLAIESGVDEAEARDILAEHLDQVVLGKSREGKLIARLTSR